MRTSEHKKSYPQFSIQAPKPIRLRFQNIKSQEESQVFTTQDVGNVQLVCKGLQQAIKEKKDITNEILELNVGLLRKLKKYCEKNEKENNDPNKIRFKIVKSAKKGLDSGNQIKRNVEEFQIQSPRPSVIPSTSIHQNRSQLIQMKENLSKMSQHLSFSSSLNSSISGILPGKVKLKKIAQGKKIQICEGAQLKAISNEDLIKKMKLQLRKLSTNYLSKCEENENLSQRMKDLEKKKEDMELRLIQMEQLEKINLELKFSLKCLEQEKPSIKSSSKMQNISSEQKKQSKIEYEKAFYQELTNHLKLTIVSQNKEIQILQKKMSGNGHRNFPSNTAKWDWH